MERNIRRVILVCIAQPSLFAVPFYRNVSHAEINWFVRLPVGVIYTRSRVRIEIRIGFDFIDMKTSWETNSLCPLGRESGTGQQSEVMKHVGWHLVGPAFLPMLRVPVIYSTAERAAYLGCEKTLLNVYWSSREVATRGNPHTFLSTRIAGKDRLN